MPKYRVWEPSSQDERHATEVTAETPQRAAELWCARTDASGLEYPLERVVRVRDDDTALVDFVVELRAEPVYTARKRKVV